MNENGPASESKKSYAQRPDAARLGKLAAEIESFGAYQREPRPNVFYTPGHAKDEFFGLMRMRTNPDTGFSEPMPETLITITYDDLAALFRMAADLLAVQEIGARNAEERAR